MSSGFGQAPTELDKLLNQAMRLNAVKARAVLQRVFAMLDEEAGNLTAKEREKLSAGVARAIEHAVRRPLELGTLMNDKVAWSVSRQVTYRRYREQWQLESPLRLLAIFDCPAGRPPLLITVRPLPAE